MNAFFRSATRQFPLSAIRKEMWKPVWNPTFRAFWYMILISPDAAMKGSGCAERTYTDKKNVTELFFAL